MSTTDSNDGHEGKRPFDLGFRAVDAAARLGRIAMVPSNGRQKLAIYVSFVLFLLGLIFLATPPYDSLYRMLALLLVVAGIVGIATYFLAQDYSSRDDSPEQNGLETIVSAPSASPGRFFIGIDVGRDTIDYCILDTHTQKYTFDKLEADHGQKETPRSAEEACKLTAAIINELLAEAESKRWEIHGIGIGLPGWVDPKRGTLGFSPGFEATPVNIVEDLKDLIDPKLVDSVLPNDIQTIPIEIDNDARCATRYALYEFPKKKDFVCIYVGRGVGSGIVANGNLLYGRNFVAGEIGHATVCYSSGLFPGHYVDKCACEKSGEHWEMFVSSMGMLNLMTRNSEAYEKFENEGHIRGPKLTTYDIRKAYLDGNEYASEVVKEYIGFLAMGLATYISILNPEEIVLGGGMIRGFYDTKYKSQTLGKRSTAEFLRAEIRNYAIAASFPTEVQVRALPPIEQLAAIGAGLIFKDKSYYRYKQGS